MLLEEILRKAVNDGASDIFIIAGSPLSYKIQGSIVSMQMIEKLLPDSTSDLIEQIYKTANRSEEKYKSSGDDDFSFSIANLARFRINTYCQRGSRAAVIRVIPFSIPDYRELGIPKEVMEISGLFHGMVLISGTAGSGKSTTQACIIDAINQKRQAHVVTLEDPIEYLHRNNQSIISQREVSIDTKSYISGLRACLRQAPDVILLGEMRDSETIQTAITAAETGHLVIATLHTKGAVNTIDRIIDSFPANQQLQVRIQLSMVLDSVISQQLLPAINGGMVPAVEIMKSTPAIRNMIRDSKVYQIENAIQTSNKLGMLSMDQSIMNLYKEKRITADVALEYAVNQEQMKRKLELEK
ncbi:type IV pilus twitching motility protein PilT [Velocimicrobium porci]|uniref:PilT/PilU family type 4a pilus ATPase n=1 Tax=Velocimicrobium porci TaxID=2606634 RepID=A0A6L5Y2Z1_9FIRM|nr:PilT/PilU family type 4a pilus ATPase [Velocimicrobium porci]MSS64718.1 PilT/PilU family type 4a pilus ATPase [Velocimicrobium porci]